ncbi:nuclear transport factor 2 family protein [Sessilibacter corallicola]|uniref:Nuclear transport factor 2 family protein n=1 Tax=Sessilibacter corallicola TaxID=2904075 RepID=A0ABQ0AF41_9GAMM
MIPTTIEKWHLLVKTKNTDLLDEILADDVNMHSPVVHTVQKGKEITKMYLSAASKTLCNNTFKYVREVYDEDFALLEFETEINGISVNGVDMISLNSDGKISDFKVMVRPLKGINVVHQVMGEALSAIQRR